MRMMPTPRMRRHFLMSTTTTTMLIVVLLATGRNVNGDEAAAEDPPQQEPRSKPEDPPPQQPQNKPEDQTDTYGLGEQMLNEDGTAVTLADGSRKAEDADLKNYQESGRGTFKGKGCTVTKDGKFFIVHYDEEAAIEGCAVDFIITDEKMAKTIEFKASVKDASNYPDQSQQPTLKEKTTVLLLIVIEFILLICIYRKYKKAKANPAGIIESGTRKDGNMDGPEKMIKPTMVQTEAEYGSEDFDDPSNMDNRRKDDGLEETKMDGHQQHQPKDNDDADDNRKKDDQDEGCGLMMM